MEGDSCVLCGENTIEPTSGNATSCNETCDAPATVPNNQRTDCGEYFTKVSHGEEISHKKTLK